jgi:hypothetical protein
MLTRRILIKHCCPYSSQNLQRHSKISHLSNSISLLCCEHYRPQFLLYNLACDFALVDIDQNLQLLKTGFWNVIPFLATQKVNCTNYPQNIECCTKVIRVKLFYFQHFAIASDQLVWRVDDCLAFEGQGAGQRPKLLFCDKNRGEKWTYNEVHMYIIIDWLLDWLINWLIDWCYEWLIDCLIAW